MWEGDTAYPPAVGGRKFIVDETVYPAPLFGRFYFLLMRRTVALNFEFFIFHDGNKLSEFGGIGLGIRTSILLILFDILLLGV